MKVFISFLTGVLFLLMFSCQSELTDNGFSKDSDSKISDFEVSANDAIKKFSHTPTGEVYVETPDQPSVIIDFSCNEYLVYQTSDKDFILVDDGLYINVLSYSYENSGKMDTISTIGQLITVYNDFTQYYPGFSFGWSSYLYPPRDGDYIYPTIEYLLAQACFQDDCSSVTRKAVLKATIEKQTYKFEQYLISYDARKTGLFLMAVILIKEKYIPFITAVHDNSDLQNAIRMNVEDSRIDKEFSDFVSQYAIQFLSD